MPICNICNNNEANQTGTHIFPAWMVASAFDENSNPRDFEIIYAFHPLDAKLPYFGRSVQPDKIEEELGRDLSDEEIKGQDSFLTVDNLWCRDCERRLKIVEDYFLENVDREIEDFSKCDDTQIVELTEVNTYIIRLFLYSLIFRAALTKLMDFKIKDKIFKRLRYFINTYIKEDLNSTKEFIEASETKQELLTYPVKLVKTEQKSGDTSNFVHIHNKFDKPYCFVINRYIIQFYAKESHTRSTPYIFWGITDAITKMGNILNYRENNFTLGLFNLKLWNYIKDKFVKDYMEERMENLILIYKVMYKGIYGEYPSKAQVKKFLDELTDNELKLGIKYTKEKIAEAMRRSIDK